VNPTAGASGTPDLTESGAGTISSFDTIGIRTANVDGLDTFWIELNFVLGAHPPHADCVHP